MTIKFIKNIEREMSNGMRDISNKPLNEKEIEYIKEQFKSINGDENILIFNPTDDCAKGTCYDYHKDVIYVKRNIFPDYKYGSTHPRDLMSVTAVLAHEYYGHRKYRQEYLDDYVAGQEYKTTPYWKDECRASITAAEITPNLTYEDRKYLILDAFKRAEENGQVIEMDDKMIEMVYGYSKGERNITQPISHIKYVSIDDLEQNNKERENNHGR